VKSLGAWELAAIAFVLLAFSAVSRRFERSVVTAAIFFTFRRVCWRARWSA
jgi:hypothetical protein